MDKDRHSIILENRKKLLIEGVLDVISFDETIVELDSVGGRLTVSETSFTSTHSALKKGKLRLKGKYPSLYTRT